MWSTVTLTPTFLPQSWAKGRNHWSWLGTKWLQSRILRSPESLVLGSVKLTDGAWPAASSPPPGPPPPGSLVQAAMAAPMPATPTARRNCRRSGVHNECDRDPLSAMWEPPLTHPRASFAPRRPKGRFTQVQRAYASEFGSQVPAGMAGGRTSTLRPRPLSDAMPSTPAHSSGGQAIP